MHRMTRERALDGLIGRLVDGAGLVGGAETSALDAAEAARLEALGRVFAGFSKLRDEAAPPPFAAHAAGDRAGAFRLAAPLGAGGMGEVWLAERCDGAVEQRVAIKFIRHARVGLAERFAREQRALARLAHPRIARFLDAGRSADGAAYLVMEYVDGAPIDAWCDARALDVAARIDLVLEVCDAVDHAHRQLVVHRDIKPSNILVSAGGAPTLLDFGVAKLLDDSGVETVQPALTLAYAAPEQCRGETVSTATDVFSLGLVLFRLLARTLPPSRREANLATLAAARDVESLAASAPGVRELAGDLDAIVGKATRADSRERYGSVAALADDLRCFRAARPVRARAQTRAYRARKFVARHRLAVAASAIAALALATGFGAALWQANRADAESVRATRVADFLVRLFREQDPLARAGANARSPRELVADGVLRARSELADQPALRASLLGVLGEATMNLGDLGQGRTLLEEARAATRDGTSDAARLDGWLGSIAMRQGRQAEGLALVESAIARLEAGSREDRLAAASLQIWRADALLRAGKVDAALETVRRAHATFEASLGPDHLDTLQAEMHLLATLSQARRDDEAEPLAKSLLARVERVAGADSPRLIDVLNWSAQIEKRRDRHANALAEFERAIALAEKHLGPRHAMLAALHSRMANVEQDDGHLEAALAALDRAAAALPDDARIERAQMLATRGDTLIDLGRADEAEASLREALALRRASSGDGDGLVWYSQSEWGRALNAQGRRAEAQKAQVEALARMEAIMGADAYQLTFVLRALAETYSSLGEHAKAALALRRAFELASRRYPPTQAVVVQYRAGLASALGDAGDADAALAESEAILAARDARLELLQYYARAALVKARVLRQRGRGGEAVLLAKQGLADLDRAGIAGNATRRDLAALAGVSL
jgi:serine/threonine-protein kinase